MNNRFGKPDGADSSRDIRGDARVGIVACGKLWQMHPDWREALTPVLGYLLREWHKTKWESFDGSARCVLPVLEILIHQPMHDDLRRIAAEALQVIKVTDPGEW